MTKPALELQGRVEAVLIGNILGSLVTTEVKKIQVVRGHGVKDDSHAGMRLADVREKAFLSFGFSKGIEIANLREFSATSIEELNQIASAMKLPNIPSGCLGENLILSGIPQLTELPTGTMLFFRKDEQQIRTAVLVVWGENAPCTGPGEAIQRCFPEIAELTRMFPRSAIGKRGIVGSVFASGNIHAGDTVIVKVPHQKIYSPQ